MKKIENNEKQPKITGALLRTYLTSLLCMVLCVAMFFGTSYAWFTSEIENKGNEIYIGTLAMDLRNDGVSLKENPSKKLFDGGIRWEPGYTALETITVVNKGDLAFQYALNFTEGKVEQGDQSLASVAQYFDVWVFNHGTHDYVKPGSYDALMNTAGWVNIGTLDDLLSGEPVIQGNMVTVVDDSGASKATEDTYTIALHMNGSATEAVMGHKITLNVKLVAYQKTSEGDSFGSDYDKARYVTDVEELQEAINNAKNGDVIRFANNITGNVTVAQKEGVKFTVDGDNNTYTGIITVDGKSNGYETAGLTIENINFSGMTCPDSKTHPDAYIRLGYDSISRYTRNVTVQNCTFDCADRTMVAVKSYTGGDHNLTLKNLKVKEGMHSLAQLKNIEKNLVVTDCEVYSKNGLNINNGNNLTMSGCTFDVQGYAVRFGESDNSTDETFTISNSTLKSACADAGDAVIEFRAGAVNATLNLNNTTVAGTVKVKGNTEATTINGLN